MIQLISSFGWHQLPSIIQLLNFLQVDYLVVDDEVDSTIGFNLYVVNAYDIEFVRNCLYLAEDVGFFRSKN